MNTKTRISDLEKKKNSLPGSNDSFDIDILEKYLKGTTIEQLANERYITRGQVEVRIKMTLKAITAFIDEKVPENYYLKALNYRDYWLNSIIHYNMIKLIRNPTSQFSVFMMYFKKCSQTEKFRMLAELEQATYD